jgi:serine phosphatase RsbU (regulator of sigma subunit)
MIRNNELSIIKADKMPIGWYEKTEKFTNHTLSMKKGDCFYMASDGFIDQFGGPDLKKYLSKPFRDFLLSIHPQPMSEQRVLLFNEFERWKGDLEQVDDLLIMGFRI